MVISRFDQPTRRRQPYHPRRLAFGVALFATVACGQSVRSGHVPNTTHAAWTRLDVLGGRPGGRGWADGTLVAAHFDGPWSIAGDGAGRLFVADGNMIRTVDRVAGTVTTLAGAYGQVGSRDGIGAQAAFNTPSGLAFADGQLYVADTENDTIRKIDVASGSVTTFAGAAGQPGALDGPAADARFLEPEGLTLDANGQLYIGDTDNAAIRVLPLATGAVSTIAGTLGTAGLADGIGAQALFKKPKGMAVDALGNVLIIDAGNQCVRRLDPTTATVSTVATFDALPQGIAVDRGNVLVSLSGIPTGNHSIVSIAPDAVVTLLAGSAKGRGFVDGVGADARFDSPAGLLDDHAGTVYVADFGNSVLRTLVVSGGAVGTLAGAKSVGSSDGADSAARFMNPLGLAADDRFAYVADTGNDTIRTIALSTGEVTTLAGAAGKPGQVDGSLAEARFNQPQGLALDVAKGILYVADTGSRAVRQIDLAVGSVRTLVLAAGPPGATAFAGFDAPSGLALDQGVLFVTDYTEQTVTSIVVAAMQGSILAGQGRSPGQADGIGASASFYGPLGITADGHGNLYVADSEGETVRKIAIATGTVSTVAGAAMVRGSDDGVGAAARFYFPTGVALDGGSLFVTDSENDTVRRIDVSTAAVTTVVGAVGAAGVRLGSLPAQLTLPTALALTPSGALLIASESSVVVAH